MLYFHEHFNKGILKKPSECLSSSQQRKPCRWLYRRLGTCPCLWQPWKRCSHSSCRQAVLCHGRALGRWDVFSPLLSLSLSTHGVWPGLERPQREVVSPGKTSPRKESAAIALQLQTNLPTLLSFQSRAPAAHSSAQAQDRPTATVSPLRTQNSPSRLPTASLRPHSVVSPQHIHQPQVQTVIGAQCPRPAIPLTSAASAVTPPNVNAANLNGEAGGGPVSGLSTSSPTNTGCRPDEKKNEKVSGPSWASPGHGPAGYCSSLAPDTNDIL